MQCEGAMLFVLATVLNRKPTFASLRAQANQLGSPVSIYRNGREFVVFVKFISVRQSDFSVAMFLKLCESAQDQVLKYDMTPTSC